MTSSRKVSNSEVVAFNTCERKYYYQYDLNLEPKTPSTSIYRGTVGHACLEAYYLTLQGLFPGQKTPEIYARAERAGMMVLTNKIDGADLNQSQALMELRILIGDYFRYAKRTQHDWLILQVEQFYDLDLTEDFSYSLRLDLVARIDGMVTIIDHKFVYNFWSQDDLDLSPQLPKYTAALRAHGIRVDRCLVNQIRTRIRQSKPYEDHEKFKYSYSVPNDQEIQNHLIEQIKVSRRVVDHRALPIEVRAREVTRTLSQMVCRMCSVRNLCIMELKGISVENDIKIDFQQNTYDYNRLEIDEGVQY
jgi:hypothetical protein